MNVEFMVIYLLLGFEEERFELDVACDLPGLLKPPGFSPLNTFWTASLVSISFDIIFAKAWKE